jgi:hypothetical protein
MAELSDAKLDDNMDIAEAISSQLVFHTIRYRTNDDASSSTTFVTSALLPVPAIAWIQRQGPMMMLDEGETGTIVKKVTYGRKGVEEKGRMMPIKREVVTGEVILRERPVVLLPRSVFLGQLEMNSIDIFDTLGSRVSDIVDSKAGSPKTKLMKLSNSKPRSSCQLEGIIRSNGLSLVLNSKDLFTGVFIRIARCNHSYVLSTQVPYVFFDSLLRNSCSPSAALRWDAKSLTMTLYAVRDIKKSEEITISYIDPLHTGAERQKIIAHQFGFSCSCSKCTLKAGPRMTSDEARSKLRKWLSDPDRRTFKSWMVETEGKKDRKTLQAFDSELSEYLKLLKAENLEVLRPAWMEISDGLACVALAMADKHMLSKLRTAREIWNWDGSMARSIQDKVALYDSWIEDPASAPFYASRSL